MSEQLSKLTTMQEDILRRNEEQRSDTQRLIQEIMSMPSVISPRKNEPLASVNRVVGVEKPQYITHESANISFRAQRENKMAAVAESEDEKLAAAIDSLVD